MNMRGVGGNPAFMLHATATESSDLLIEEAIASIEAREEDARA